MNATRSSGRSDVIYYKPVFYDPKKKGEELQFQYILKNRLDSFRIPYAIGKEAFEGELYIVKVTKGALWHEEIVTLGKVLALETGDENGSSDRILSALFKVVTANIRLLNCPKFRPPRTSLLLFTH